MRAIYGTQLIPKRQISQIVFKSKEVEVEESLKSFIYF